ncbi:NUDIX domain-containing protein [Bacillus salacetis]|uniref:NUDIX domain-containing protein n=1 Tax=Bacillus salacetis TaxID=2315464 RepID=A0A3A1QYU5_9BACI|nr:NUDIX hydrolase [Bacillus salacetis]RIW34001.1 NUDIX domain-containing protein [Bacillus salacetis]
MEHKWMKWAQQIQSISQSGLAFSKDVYDIERYEELKDLSAEIMSEYTTVEKDVIKELFAQEKGYQTPKADVRGAVFEEGRILLVKEKINNKWSLPGGFCDVGLSPSENVIKEIKEESGYEVRYKKLLALLDYYKHPHPPQPFHYYKIFIQCEITGGNPQAGLETSEIGFFEEDALPDLSVDRNTASQIRLLFEFLRDPDKKTVCD